MTDLILKVHELVPSEGYMILGLAILIVVAVSYDVISSIKAK